MDDDTVSHITLYKKIVENHAEVTSQLNVVHAEMKDNGEKADQALKETHRLREEVNTGKNTVKFLVWLGGGALAIWTSFVAWLQVSGNG